MLRFVPTPGTDRAELVIEGDVTANDYERIRPALERFVRTHEKPRLLIEVQDLGDVGLQAIGEDLRLTTEHANDFAKVAFVSDASWQRALVSMMGPMSSADVRGFERGERTVAETWLQA